MEFHFFDDTQQALELLDGQLLDLRQGLAQGKGMNDSCAGALLHLMAATEDTNLIKRGGWQTQKQLQARLQDMLAQDPFPATEVIEALDQEFIEKNLSPGGCADLLAVTLFLDRWERIDA